MFEYFQILGDMTLTLVNFPSRKVNVLSTSMQLQSGPVCLPCLFQATIANPISTMSPVLNVPGSFSTYLYINFSMVAAVLRYSLIALKRHIHNVVIETVSHVV
jgi:hypothetical protein